MTANVPKFTSFRPKPKAPTGSVAASKSRSRSRSPEHSARPKERTQKRSSTDAKVEPSTHHASAARSEAEKQKQSLRKRETTASELFFIDRRGDPDILKYGSLDRYKIPAFRPIGYGSILGLPPRRKIDRDQSTDKLIVLVPERPRRQGRPLTSKNFKIENGRGLKLMKSTQTEDLGADFIPLSTSRKRKRELEAENKDSNGLTWGHDESTAEQPLDSDVENDSDTVSYAATTEVTQRNLDLVRKTREHPEDVQAWIDLADHQEALMRMDRPTLELSLSDKQHLADVRISTYEQALKRVVDDQSKVTLYAALLAAAQRTWGVDRLTLKWADVLVKFPCEESLWSQYLQFVQTCFTEFKYDKCLDAFLQCLSQVQPDSHIGVEFRLHMLIRLTIMIRQAGYQELAIAVWQALLEFQLLKPMSPDVSDTLQAFEEFWESEEARIGEMGAKGWSAFDPDNPQPPPAAPEAEGEPTPSLSRSPLEEFHTREHACIIKLRYPGRTLDENEDGDAFHVILFSDIERFLHIVPQTISPAFLVSAFLSFCGLPGLVGISPVISRRTTDPFLFEELRTINHADESNSFLNSLSNYMNSSPRMFQMTVELLFDQGLPDGLITMDMGFVRRVLKLLMVSFPNDEVIGEYLLALEYKYFPKDVFKTSKRLLKANPSSLRLYNAYGLVESRSGNAARAEQVFSTAVMMIKGDCAYNTSHGLDLISNWVWEALKRADTKAALRRLVFPTEQVKAGAGDDEPDQGARLRARSALNYASERALLSNSLVTAVKATALLGLLAYLSNGERLDPALAAHGALTEWFVQHDLSKSPAAELNAQSIAQLLTHHAANARIVKPSLIRHNLEPLIESFPENTVLLSVYAANEARFAIDDRVRALFHQPMLASQHKRTIIGWAFAIHHEMIRGNIAGSTTHSIRALFQKAEDDTGAHCPALWKRHILFELEEARKEIAKRPHKEPTRDGKKRKAVSSVEAAQTRVKETFFKGMTQQPWNKEYMMMAFTHLGEEFLSQEELRKVYNVMMEKELRLYVELEG